jgi:NAD-dependent deacetylase
VREQGLEALADRLRRAARVTILTGAGVSAASGVPTFRGAAGLWRQFRAEDLATASAFRRDPMLVWDWYAWRREMVASCQPNAGHEVIASWSARRNTCRVITQNVDDLHVRAGTSGLIRLHGSLWDLACWDRCGAKPWRDEQAPFVQLPPRCPHCGGLARPGVVWFGEALNPDDVDAALAACVCDIFLTVGTSSVVYPAAGLVHEAKRLGAFTAEINVDPTPASAIVDLAIQGPSEVVLPEVEKRLHH